MSCAKIGTAIVCGSWGNPNMRKVIYCPTCEQRRWFLVHWAGMWYGQDITCLTCGDSWADGERAMRPFVRGWRKEAIAKAKATPVVKAAEYRAFIRREIAEWDEFSRGDETE
jgi:hypothetical protein